MSTPCFAHAVFEKSEARQNSTFRAVLQIMHGCKGSPTTAVSVQIPDGVTGVRPLAKSGWTVATERGPYAESYASRRGTVSEGVKTISWSGGKVPDDEFDEFVFLARITDKVAANSTVFFPVVQSCETGAFHWTQVPAGDADPHALSEPAPGLRILAAASEMAQAAPAATVGALHIEQPWIRATPPGAQVAGGYVKIVNTGSEPDRLVAAAIPVAGRGEVHEMTMEGNVMKMRPVAGGIVIAPGASVELKPGGYHLMFMDLHSALKPGETVKGSLTFAKAGKVDVTFTVTGMGDTAPPAMEHMDHMDHMDHMNH
jgi:copper(I)-binding protein/uncharacterized protein YcnI